MNITKEVASDLTKLKGAWKDAKPPKTTGGGLPDGEYLTQIMAMAVGHSKGSGRLQVSTTFLVKDGKYAGKKHMKFDSLETDQNIGWFKSYCAVLGIELSDNPVELPATLDEFVHANKNLVNIQIRTKGGFTNTYAKGLSEYEIESVGEETNAEYEASADDTITEEFVDESAIQEEEAETFARPASRPVARPAARPAVKSSGRPAAVAAKRK